VPKQTSFDEVVDISILIAKNLRVPKPAEQAGTLYTSILIAKNLRVPKLSGRQEL